jgi:hypothetical protein
MNSITIAGKSVAYHFGLHFSEMFPKALTKYESFSRIDFITEAIVAAHDNYCKMKAEPRAVERHEVFAFAEEMSRSEDVAGQVKIFLADYAVSDFGQAADKISAEINNPAPDESLEKKSRKQKTTGGKQSNKPSE